MIDGALWRGGHDLWDLTPEQIFDAVTVVFRDVCLRCVRSSTTSPSAEPTPSVPTSPQVPRLRCIALVGQLRLAAGRHPPRGRRRGVGPATGDRQTAVHAGRSPKGPGLDV